MVVHVINNLCKCGCPTGIPGLAAKPSASHSPFGTDIGHPFFCQSTSLSSSTPARTRDIALRPDPNPSFCHLRLMTRHEVLKRYGFILLFNIGAVSVDRKETGKHDGREAKQKGKGQRLSNQKEKTEDAVWCPVCAGMRVRHGSGQENKAPPPAGCAVWHEWKAQARG